MQTNKDKRRLPRLARGFAVLGIALAVAAPGRASAAPTETVLHSFLCILPACLDGFFPEAGLIADSAGNLYGTTGQGGPSRGGTVFKLSPAGTETVLHSLTGSDGAFPQAGLIADSAGNLYGTTYFGGASNLGVVFKLSPGGTETVLHTFTGGSDGANPGAGLIADSAGNLYGTTQLGGGPGGCGLEGCGVVFKLSPGGTETVLYSFMGGNDADPLAGLIADSTGNLYGTTEGEVFKLSPGGTETVLYTFCSLPGCIDGQGSFAGLIADSAGNLYGTTINGGGSRCRGFGCGVVFKLSPPIPSATKWTETVLYSFCKSPDCTDGAVPSSGLIADSAGNLYGTTGEGGASGHGVVFKLSPGGTETVLHSFCISPGCPGGAQPLAGLLGDSAGNLYGTTVFGGVSDRSRVQGGGVVFKLTGTGFVAAVPSAQR